MSLFTIAKNSHCANAASHQMAEKCTRFRVHSRFADELFLLRFFVCPSVFAAARLLGFSLSRFHCLAVLFGTFGAELLALLALLVESRFAAKQLDEGNIATIPAAKAAMDDAQVAAVAVPVTRRDLVEQ